MATTLDSLNGLLRDLRASALARTNAEFETAGGCSRCNGWGTVLTWSTMDGSAYDEFGRCPNPSCTASTVGKRPGSCAPGTGRYEGTEPLRFTPEELVTLEEIENEIHRLKEIEAEIEDLKTVRKGSDVKVVRGRKVPVGTTGKVFWIGDTAYGVRVGINTSGGETVWTAVTNVEVVI